MKIWAEDPTVTNCSSLLLELVKDRSSRSEHRRGWRRQCRKVELYQVCAGHEESAFVLHHKEEDVLEWVDLQCATTGDRLEAGHDRPGEAYTLAATGERECGSGCPWSAAASRFNAARKAGRNIGAYRYASHVELRKFPRLFSPHLSAYVPPLNIHIVAAETDIRNLL